MPRRFAVVSLTLVLAGCAFARVSVPDGQPTVDANGQSRGPSVSDGGRYIAFESTATNLVADDTNGVSDVFVHDVVLRTTIRVSVAAGGGQANGASRSPSISDDGRRVAFESDASNLSAQDGDAVTDVYLRDLDQDSTELVSIGPGGAAVSDPAVRPTLSGDGSVVAFPRRASVPICCFDAGPVVRDLDAGTSFDHGGILLSGGLSLSDDGSRLVLGSIAPSGTDAAFGVAVVSSHTGQLISPVDSGVITHASQGSFLFSLSGDGGRVAYWLGNSRGGSLTVRDVTSAGVPVRSLGRAGVTRVEVGDDGESVVFRAVGPAGYEINRWNSGGVHPVSLTPAGGIGGFRLSGDGAWIAVVGSGVLFPGDGNGLDDVYLDSVEDPPGVPT